MKNLKVSFHLNKELDYEIGLTFLNNSEPKSGYDFVKLITNLHPKLKRFYKIDLVDRQKYLYEYIDSYYDIHEDKLIKAKNEFKQEWKIVEAQFFKVTSKYFNSLEWPDGKYYCNISIFPIGPRFLESCEFQTCYTWGKNLKGQIIHEMLHFQFYNLVKSLGLDKTKSAEFIWELSEVFNDVIQQESDYVEIQGYRSNNVSYPGLTKKLIKYKKIWQKDKNASQFISKILN